MLAFGKYKLGLLLWANFDKIHRLVNDIKLSLKNCLCGVFMLAQFYSAYIFGVAYKPFGTGAFMAQKMQLHEMFLVCEDTSSDIWRKYEDYMATAWHMPCSSDTDRDALWDEFANLPGFKNKMSFPKLARWFSWHECFVQQVDEYHATRMVYERHVDADESPDATQSFDLDRLRGIRAARNPRDALASLRKICGGIPLAYRLMSQTLFHLIKILFTMTCPCWSQYTREVKHAKTAKDAYRYSMKMADGAWLHAQHLKDTVRLFHDAQSLSYMEVDVDANGRDEAVKWAEHVVMLGWHVIKYQAWSLSKHAAPIECYANAASGNEAKVGETMANMKRDWTNLLRVEQRAASNSAGDKLLLKDLDTSKCNATRLFFHVFERDRFSARSFCGRRMLNAFLQRPPDNKLVEDIHNVIRRDAKGNTTLRQTSDHINDLINGSQALEVRGIPHPASVSRASFMAEFDQKKGQSRRNKHKGSRGKLPRRWSTIMGPRRWTAISEDRIHSTTAAWMWLRHYYATGLDIDLTRDIGDGIWNKFAVPFVVLTNDVNEGPYYASLGNGVWASLGWPLLKVLRFCAYGLIH